MIVESEKQGFVGGRGRRPQATTPMVIVGATRHYRCRCHFECVHRGRVLHAEISFDKAESDEFGP